MTLLARTTTPLRLTPDLMVEDYRILHLSHSDNDDLNTLSERHLRYSGALTQHTGSSLHSVWKSLLAPDDARRFVGGYWNLHFDKISDTALRSYLTERYA